MARYIDVVKSAEIISEKLNIPLDDLVDVFAEIPTADVVEVKRIEIIRDDLKWWLETNTEKGVVYIPKYVIENMIVKMDGERK